MGQSHESNEDITRMIQMLQILEHNIRTRLACLNIFSKLNSFPLPIFKDNNQEKRGRIRENHFHGDRQFPLLTTRESLQLAWTPYLLLIMECHKESQSMGNLHNHFLSRALFLAIMLPIVRLPLSLGRDTTS